MSEDVASAKIDLKFLVTLGVIFGGVLIGWTANREKVIENADDITALTRIVDEVLAEQGRLGNRVLTIETGMSYRAGTVDQINAKIDRLIETLGTEPRPSTAPGFPR